MLLRCLYIVSQDPISPNFKGGGSAIYYEHLAALRDLGHSVHLWHYASPSSRESFDRFVRSDDDIWDEVQGMCDGVTLSTTSEGQSLPDRLQNRIGRALLGRKPMPRVSLGKTFRKLVAETRPKLIWAQHFEPALIASSQTDVPVIYSHHDWLYRIKALRFGRGEDPRMQQLEERVARDVEAVVSGSAVECDELRKLGVQKVHYIPVSYRPVECDAERESPPVPRLVHLGGMGTTASRAGLERFFEIVWPALRPNPPELMVVGDTGAAPPRLKEFLANVKCTGHVPSLQSVLRPFDLHIIPWEYNTGQRTRLPVAFNHAQVVVAVRASVACFPEAQNGVNCRLVDRLEEMPTVIRELVADADQRERLGRSARATFESQFTRKALLPRYQQLISLAV